MGRRGPKEDSIHHRKDGRWAGVIHRGYDTSGKRLRHYVYAETRAGVVAALKRAHQKLDQGQRARDSRQRLSDFLDSWLAEIVEPHLAPGTYQHYANFVRLHLKPSLGRTRLDELTPPLVQRWVNDLRRSGRTAYVARRSLHILHNALRQAVDWQLLVYNPADRVKAPKHVTAKRVPLTPDDAKQLVEAARGHRFEAVFLLWTTVGLRHGEALGLRWSDVDWTRRELTLSQQVQYQVARGMVAKPLKTAGSVRTVALPRVVVEALQRRQEQQRFEAAAVAGWSNESGLIFTRPDGGALNDSVTRRAWYRLLKQMGLDKRPPHAGRHTAGTWSLLGGIAPPIAAAALGHVNPRLLLELYGNHSVPEDQRLIADLVDRLLGT